MFDTKHKLPVMKDVRNLGVIFDSTLSMTNHISTICRTTYMHLHNISRIRRYLTPEATKSLVHALIMSRLDYGNALLAGLPLEHLKKFQRIQNIAIGVRDGGQGGHAIYSKNICVRDGGSSPPNSGSLST